MKLRQRFRDAWDVLAHDAKIVRTRKSIPSVNEEDIADVKMFFPMDKFFILGHSRSGNTLLMRLVRLHPEVHANYQGTFFSRPPGLASLVNTPEVEKWFTRGTNRWNRGRDLSPRVLRSISDFIMESDARHAGPGKHIVGDKSPTTVTHGKAVRDMFQIYPDARMVYIVRDGRDVMVSDRFRNFVEEKFLRRGDDKIIAALHADPELFTGGGRSIFTESWLRDKNQGVSSWADNLKESTAEGKRLYEDRYFPIRYEDILVNPFHEMKKLWLFLDVKDVDPALEKKIHDEIADNPDEKWQTQRNNLLAPILVKGRPGNWKNFFSEHDREIFKEIAADLLTEWGYEKNSDW
jgi:Sulfotransferase family